MPKATLPNDAIVVELCERMGADSWGDFDPQQVHLWDWQKTMLAQRCAALLRDPASGRQMRFQALSFLVGVGPYAEVAVPELIAAFQGTDDVECHQAIEVAQTMAPAGRSVIQPLIAFISDADAKDDWTICSAIEALGRFGPAASVAVPELQSLAENPPEVFEYTVGSIRRSAVIALGQIGSSSRPALTSIQSLIHDADYELHTDCLEALGRIDPLADESRVLIAEGLRDPEVGIRRISAQITIDHQVLLDPNVHALVEELAHGTQAERLAAARALMALGAHATAARQELASACIDENRSIRLFAIEALWEIGEKDPVVRRALEPLASDDDPMVAKIVGRHLEY